LRGSIGSYRDGQGRGEGNLQAPGLVYGSQLTTRQERNHHRARMNAATTGQERDQIHQAHQEQMQERAKNNEWVPAVASGGSRRMKQVYQKVSGMNVTPESCAAASLSCLRRRALHCLSELELETDREGIEIGIRHFIAFRIET
jgi:hypothetical protein